MKLTDKLSHAFDQQITLELSAAVVYRQLSIAMGVADLPGLAQWLRAQSDEEVVHADKFITHVVDRQGSPKIGAIEAPKVKADATPQDVFAAALAHEEKVSEAIRNLYRLADAEGDLDSRPLLNWFLDEQIEEEATVGEILAQIKMVGDDGPGLLRLDAELGRRTGGGAEEA
ncbi:ferritin [Propioniciclava coleopterorum]|uniref:Ferritin n=1 Tax=Propioniciclava coleopterorum TaxID=2714937 RepID=A0A6G7Y9J2_9ACTN|nr:ferritin [Propioniciclava coleopterorum]QIK73463.1 ferritin [Propioniciclava coleopterorum]